MLLVIKNWVSEKVLIDNQPFNELINVKSQTNRDQKSNLSFLKQHDQSQKFRLKLVKIRQKALQSIKIDDCENIYSVNPLYLIINHGNGYIEEKKWK